MNLLKKESKCLIILTFFFFFSACFNIFAQDLFDVPSISLTTINRYAHSTTDFDEVDDIRNFTSEALFSQSLFRLHRSLSKEELAKIVRVKDEFESFNNFRFRPNFSWAIDISYKYKKINNAQITNFFEPNRFNDVKVKEIGISLQNRTKIKQYGVLLRGTYNRVHRKGIIEFLPTSDEIIDQYEINTLITKKIKQRFLSFYVTYVLQNIRLDILNPYKRDRDILAFLLTYGKQQDISIGLEGEARYTFAIENIFSRRFDMRGMKFFAGYVSDIETYDNIDVKKNDYFFGASLCAWIGDKNCLYNPLDISFEIDIFTSKVEKDSSQDNAQCRANITSYYQINQYLTLLIPFKYDLAIEGPKYFENWKVGFELRYLSSYKKAFILKSYISLRYDHQNFFNVDRNLDLFSFNFSFLF